MSITDELREYAHDCCARVDDAIHAIADRIDAEHERECKEQYACGAEHGIGASIDASMIQTHGYVELPKDADGVPIHVGDYVEHVDDTFAPRAVTGINLTSDGWWVYINGVGRRPDRYRHHQPDTWEHIIEDAIRGDGGSYGCLEERFDAMVPALVARCKALAGERS